MPRKYVRKTAGPSYSQDDLRNAVNDIINKNRTYSEVELIYGVPKAVVFHRIKGRKVPLDKIGAGRPTVLTPEAEMELENCVKAKARMGYPCDKDEIKSIVAEFVKSNDLKTPFKEGVPGDDWYYCFMKRHPALSFKKPELLQKARRDARDPEVIYQFFEELQHLITQNDVVDKPQFVFNTDESGFCTDPKRLKAIGEKGKSNVYSHINLKQCIYLICLLGLVRISGGSGRESITVLATVSADGSYMPPLVVFKGAAVQARWTSEKSYPGTAYTTSSNGWMEEPQFFEWFSSTFVPHVKRVRETHNLPKQVAILLFDGHNSHISYRIVKTAIDNNIHLVKFPSHLTDKIQPLDKCVFGPVKTNWEKKLIHFAKCQLERKDSGRLPKSKFVELLGQVWVESMKSENIIKGFSSTGIYPVDSTKFPESEFSAIALQKYKAKFKEASSQESQTNVGNTARRCSVDTIFENEGAIQSSSQDISNISTLPISSTENGNVSIPSPRKIIDIFSNIISESKSNSTEIPQIKRQIVPRLKAAKYGEILTTEDVLKKMEEAECTKKQKEKKRFSRKTKKQKTDFATDSDIEKEIDIELDEESHEDDENIYDDIISESIPEVSYQRPEWKDLSVGTFLLVRFLGGSRKTVNYKYVCSVHEIFNDTGEITVLGYRRHDKFAREFILKEKDISNISEDMIEAILPCPTLTKKNRYSVYVFPGSVHVFEK